MDLLAVVQRLALALGLGLLVGLQRERVQSPLAGIRTFALITLFGALCALLGRASGGWVVSLGAVCVTALLVAGNLGRRAVKRIDPGVTTEMAALVMYGIGAYLVEGQMAVAIALGGATALLLHWKTPLHRFVARIGDADLRAIMQFVLITLVILPVLPDQTYGPYQVLNPRHIWLMVVLIVSISMVSYVAYKWLDRRSGAVLGGILGGLISSTATTVSSARLTMTQPKAVPLVALVLMIAMAVSVVRVLTEIAVVAPRSFAELTPSVWLLLGWMTVLAAPLWLLARSPAEPLPAQTNPAQLSSALLFGGIYACVMLASAAAQDLLGVRGLLGVAALSGLYDLDAITLSSARLVEAGELTSGAGSQMILIAILANQAAKATIVAALGHRDLRIRMTCLFTAVVAGGGVIFWWGTR